jgi:hypothetical protein
MNGQWALLNTRGFGRMFAGTWIEGDDHEEVARLLGADPAQGVSCGLDEAMREYEPYAFRELVWLGAHAPGWTHAITIAGPRLRTDLLAAAGRRFAQVVWDAGALGVHDLYYGDGVTAGQQSPVRIADPWPLRAYADGLAPSRPGLIDVFTGGPAQATGSLGLWLENWLVLAGRISGRFMDEEYFQAERRLYSLPL